MNVFLYNCLNFAPMPKQCIPIINWENLVLVAVSVFERVQKEVYWKSKGRVQQKDYLEARSGVKKKVLRKHRLACASTWDWSSASKSTQPVVSKIKN